MPSEIPDPAKMPEIKPDIPEEPVLPGREPELEPDRTPGPAPEPFIPPTREPGVPTPEPSIPRPPEVSGGGIARVLSNYERAAARRLANIFQKKTFDQGLPLHFG